MVKTKTIDVDSFRSEQEDEVQLLSMVQISENQDSKAFVNRVLYTPQNQASILLCLDTNSSMIKVS